MYGRSKCDWLHNNSDLADNEQLFQKGGFKPRIVKLNIKWREFSLAVDSQNGLI